MAIKGKINHKGFEINAYIKVSIIGVSENITDVKKFILTYGYGVRANSESEQFANGTEQCEIDPTKSVFNQAYKDLAVKLNIKDIEV